MGKKQQTKTSLQAATIEKAANNDPQQRCNGHFITTSVHCKPAMNRFLFAKRFCK
jgi:hypothetical protein